MRSSEFHYAAPLAWILLCTVPAVLVAAFSRTLRLRRRPAPASGERLLPVLLIVSVAATLGGAALAFFGVLGQQGDFSRNPFFLGGVGLLGTVALLLPLALWLRGRENPVFTFPVAGLASRIASGRPGVLRLASPFFRALAVLLLLVGLARPQVSTVESDVYTEGMDIVITLDLSTTMRAVDFSPPERRSERLSRIEGAKQVIADFIRQRRNDRLGLVVFSGEAFTQCPLTLDYSVILNILQALRTGVIEDGTAIGDALMVSVNRLRDSESKSKAIILVTDGDDNMSRVAPTQAAEMAAENRIRIFPILVGRGGQVPFPVGTDAFGNTHYQNVEIRTNPELLKNIAKLAQGEFYQATDTQALREDLQSVLDHMEKTRLMDPGRYSRHTEIFQLALLGALLSLLLDLCLRWSPRLRSFP